MSLREYRRKRNFRRTPEPAPRTVRGEGWRFVIQKHAARHLHYDFRLELDGVLKSWAVPKGPSLDPKVRRLAMHVEDHPVEYGEFEGTIPEGEYGGGTVMLWDTGTWESVGEPREGYRSGKLKFQLHGKKLQGRWMLVKRSRSSNGKDNEWFLFKERDDAARPAEVIDVVRDEPLSVASGRDLDQIAADQDRVWRSNRPSGKRRTKPGAVRRKKRKPIAIPAKLVGAKRAALPSRVDVQLATLVKEAPNGNDWLHEIKFDGYRIIARIDNGSVQFFSRNHKSWTKKLEHLTPALAALPVKQAILDGEVVAFRADGTTDFQSLQNAFSTGRVGELVYYAFDLLYLNGMDLRRVALEGRKKLLERIVADSQSGAIRYSDHIVGNGPQFFQEASQRRLEGIISKLRNRPYVAGRSPDWLKVKASLREEFVIGGFTDPGKRSGFGALLLGYYDKSQKLRYAGKVGTGFTEAMLGELRLRLEELRQEKSPFVDLSRATGEARGAHWVRPKLVGQVAFTEWTRDGQLRHPSFQGLRDDKPAQSVVRDRAAGTAELTQQPPPAARRGKSAVAKSENQFASTGPQGEGTLAGVRLTSPDKVLFAGSDITKLELAQYYLSIARWILPHVANRPLSLVRCPEGTGKKCFFQKHPGAGTPPTIRLVPIKEKDKTRNYLVVDKAEDLIALAQIGALEIHVWGSQADKLERPDRMIFDLDPDPSVPWPRVVESAHQIRSFLGDIGLESFVKTTGGKGLHVVVPLQRRHDWDEVKSFSKFVAELVERADPRRYTSKMSKAARQGKIYIDYLRNGRSATAIAAYSTRARPGATVSVPLAWEELTPALRSDAFNIRNLSERLNALKHDPWVRIGSVKQSLTKSMKKQLGFDTR